MLQIAYLDAQSAGGLPTLAIIGIVIGALLLLTLVLLAIRALLRRG